MQAQDRPPAASFDAQRIEHFMHHGYVVVPGLIRGDDLERLRRGYHRAVAGEYRPEAWRDRWGPDRLLQLPDPSRHIAEWADSRHVAVIERVARRLMGADLHFAYDQLIMKPAGDPHPTPWHQDSGYWQGRERALTCWLAVEDVDADMGCMQFIPGSHREGLVEHRSVAHRTPSPARARRGSTSPAR